MHVREEWRKGILSDRKFWQLTFCVLGLMAFSGGQQANSVELMMYIPLNKGYFIFNNF